MHVEHLLVIWLGKVFEYIEFDKTGTVASRSWAQVPWMIAQVHDVGLRGIT